MYVFSSLGAALQHGFRWHSYSSSERLHVVEVDRCRDGGQRVKALAFARPSPEELADLGADRS